MQTGRPNMVRREENGGRNRFAAQERTREAFYISGWVPLRTGDFDLLIGLRNW